MSTPRSRPRCTVALVGYVTLDFIAQGDAPVMPQGTNPIHLTQGGWPRLGGAPAYAGRALMAAGHDATLVANIGADASGATLIEQMRRTGLSTSAVEQGSGYRTPVCVLIHQPGGGYCCFLDRGGSAQTGLSPSQRDAILQADWVVICAGQSDMAHEALALTSPSQKLAWIVKADAQSFPEDLLSRLAARASVIFHNRHERDFLRRASRDRPGHQLVFETDGEHGVHIHHRGDTVTLATAMLETSDATGAGDTFAGATLAVLAGDEPAVEQAARAGLAAATRFLEQRGL